MRKGCINVTFSFAIFFIVKFYLLIMEAVKGNSSDSHDVLPSFFSFSNLKETDTAINYHDWFLMG